MTPTTYKVLLTTAFFEPGVRAGGPIKSVARIVDTARPDIAIKMLTGDKDLGSPTPYPGLSGEWVSRGGSRIFYLNTSDAAHWRNLLTRLRKERFDLLYCNSLWEPSFSILPIMATRLGLISATEILIAPRGELSPGALQLKSRMKKAFLTLWRPLLSDPSIVWHASTQLEADDIKRFWPAARIEVVEDQTDLPATPISPRENHGEPLKAVFIGRISPKKNLLFALRALADCTGPLEFSIYGPIEDQTYWSQCQEVIARMPREVRVTYNRPLDPTEVRAAFAANDIFLFPTLGENFGHVIAESLSASCPVLCSDQTPWTRVLESGGGIVLRSADVAEMTAVMQSVISMSDDDRHRMRVRAGAAYAEWQHRSSNENILNRMATSRQPSSASERP